MYMRLCVLYWVTCVRAEAAVRSLFVRASLCLLDCLGCILVCRAHTLSLVFAPPMRRIVVTFIKSKQKNEAIIVCQEIKSAADATMQMKNFVRQILLSTAICVRREWMRRFAAAKHMYATPLRHDSKSKSFERFDGIETRIETYTHADLRRCRVSDTSVCLKYFSLHFSYLQTTTTTASRTRIFQITDRRSSVVACLLCWCRCRSVISFCVQASRRVCVLFWIVRFSHTHYSRCAAAFSSFVETIVPCVTDGACR